MLHDFTDITVHFYSTASLNNSVTTVTTLPLLSGPQLLGPGPQVGARRWRYFGRGWHAVRCRGWQRQGESSVSASVRVYVLFAFVHWVVISCFELCFCFGSNTSAPENAVNALTQTLQDSKPVWVVFKALSSFKCVITHSMQTRRYIMPTAPTRATGDDYPQIPQHCTPTWEQCCLQLSHCVWPECGAR